jgi:hypothetical protein
LESRHSQISNFNDFPDILFAIIADGLVAYLHFSHRHLFIVVQTPASAPDAWSDCSDAESS